MSACGSCGKREAFSKERWRRSVPPRLRQLPQASARRSRAMLVLELGHLAGSATPIPVPEHLPWTCAPAGWTVE